MGWVVSMGELSAQKVICVSGSMCGCGGLGGGNMWYQDI